MWRLEFIDALRHNTQCINIQARVRFIKNRKAWLKHSHLENLVAFFLSARKTFVHGAIGEAIVHTYQSLLLAHKAKELGCFERRLAFVLAFLIERSAHEIHNRYARYLHRILKREENAFACANLWRHVQEILATENDFTFGNGIGRMSCQDVGKGRFACTIRTHDSMYLALVDGEVESLKYFLACNRGV